MADETVNGNGPAAAAPGMHHVAYACKDVEATVAFYEEVMGFPLVLTEVSEMPDGGFLRHVFFDTGDGSCIAFFDLHGVGEQNGWRSDLSDSVGLPIWVNHIAFRATEARQDEVKARLAAAGGKPLMELDHHWCRSLYLVDPNGIMVELCRDTPGFTPDPAEAHRLLRQTTASRERAGRLGADATV
jgi:catechol 2,3-dioxygenase-like lactoylglutathione lyase family enzyme